ncbi:MAG: hypothetical protein K0V04_44825 [Deltaproteobacteria bacterium]|nr:hypothetical protein [Deltaproteobacteria bacterium]
MLFGCLYTDQSDPNAAGIVHQCSAEYDAVLSFDFDPIVGGTQSISRAINANTAKDSTYESPFAAACRSDINGVPGWSPGDDTCATQQHRACYSDLMQHICNIAPVILRDVASDFSGNGGASIEEAAQWFIDNRANCYNHFWAGADQLHQDDYCTAEFDGFYDHPDWTPGASFTIELAGNVIAQVQNFSLEARTAFNDTGVLLPTPPATPTACLGPVDNEGEVPPVSTPGAGAVQTVLASSTPVDVLGPPWLGEQIIGSGAFGVASLLAYSTTGNDIVIEKWAMMHAGPGVVGTSSLSATASAFKLQQVGERMASLSGSYYRIAPGDGLFHLSAVVDGVSDYVVAHNSTRIDYYQASGGIGACPTMVPTCLVSRPFTIEYTDIFGDLWEVDIGSATWIP